MLLQGAGARYRAGDYSGAARLLERAIAIKRTPDALSALGECYQREAASLNDSIARDFESNSLSDTKSTATTPKAKRVSSRRSSRGGTARGEDNACEPGDTVGGKGARALRRH